MDKNYCESPEHLRLRKGVEDGVAAQSAEQVLAALGSEAIGLEVLERGFGGALTELERRACFAVYCLSRPGGLDILRAVLLSGLGGRSASQLADAANKTLTYESGKISRSRGERTLFHAAMFTKSPAAMQLALEVDRKRRELHSTRAASGSTTVHYDCLAYALRQLPWVQTDSFREMRVCLQMLLDAKAPIEAKGEKVAALELFMESWDSVREPGLLKELLGAYVKAGLVPLDHLADVSPQLPFCFAPVARAIFGENPDLATAFIELGCSIELAPAPDHPLRGDLVAFARRAGLAEEAENQMVAALTGALMRRRISETMAAANEESAVDVAPAPRRTRVL